jgi:hypothetical protein
MSVVLTVYFWHHDDPESIGRQVVSFDLMKQAGEVMLTNLDKVSFTVPLHWPKQAIQNIQWTVAELRSERCSVEPLGGRPITMRGGDTISMPAYRMFIKLSSS